MIRAETSGRQSDRDVVKRSNIRAFDCLIEKNSVDILSSQDQYGNTILHGAVMSRHIQLVAHVFNKYSDMLNLVNHAGETPFFIAVRVGNLEAIKLLITSGRIDLTHRNIKGQHVIDHASEQGHLHIVKHLVEICGVSPNTKSRTHLTPLHWAAGTGQLGVVQYLVAKGADIRSGDSHGRTPLMGAVTNGSMQTVIFLIRNGALIGRRDAQGATVLHLAAQAGKLQIVKLLIEQCKFPVDAVDNSFHTSLGYAAVNGQIAVMEYLIEHGANIVGVHSALQSPLLSALNQRQTDAAVFLVRHGARVENTHLNVLLLTGKLEEILRGATDVLASGQIDDTPFCAYVNHRAYTCCASNDKDVAAQKFSAWMNSENGRACALLTQVAPFFRELYQRGREEVRKIQETEAALRQYVPRDVAELILSGFLPTPQELLNQGQNDTSADGDKPESSDSDVDRKRQHDDVDSGESLDVVRDDHSEGTDEERARQSSEEGDDTSEADRPAKRQRRR